MKILHVIPFFSPKFGGSVTVPYQLSKELAKKGNNVTIITSDYGFDLKYAKEIEEFDVKVIPFRTIVNFGLFIYTPSMKSWLCENIRNFDIVHMHNFRSYQNNLTADFAIQNRIPYIMQAHGSVLPFFEKQGLKKIYDLLWGNKLLKNASKCIAVSRMERYQYLQMDIPENKIAIIPNGIDISDFKNLPEKGIFRNRYSIKPDEKIILYLGRVHKSKGIDFLINAFSKLVVQNNNTRLVIIGPDAGYLNPLKEQVNELKIKDKVLFCGPLYEQQKFEALIDADVLVYPSTIEIFGLVPFEAIMCGTPIIVTDDCGCGEIVKEADCGYLVKYGDISGLSTKIREILTNPYDANEKVKCGQRCIKENLQYHMVVETFLKFYDSCSYTN